VTAYVTPMTSLPATKARAKLYALMDHAAKSHKPIQITGKRSNSILISEEDWSAIQETLYLLGVAGMRESIVQGMKEPADSCTTEVEW
jgi:antitoxin YefM